MKITVKLNHQGETGSARIVLFFLVLAIGMLWAGGQKIHTALTNRTPRVMGYADYVSQKPSAAWLTLTNCQLDLIHSCYLSYVGDKNAGEQSTYYIPLFDPGSDSKQVHVLLKSSNPGFLSTIREMINLKSDADAETWFKKNRDRVFPRQSVTGLVCSGMDLKDSDREKLAGTQKNIAEDFIILDENGQPSMTAGIACTGAGLASLCGLIVYFRKKQE
jgi:hypothetical protein